MGTYLSVLKKYATFSGRASRHEYWMFTLMNIVVIIGLSVLMLLVPTLVAFLSPGVALILIPVFYLLICLYLLAILLPTLAVLVRRLHDTNKPGWFMLIPIVPLIFTLMRGTQGSNSYGEDPYGNGQDTQNLM